MYSHEISSTDRYINHPVLSTGYALPDSLYQGLQKVNKAFRLYMLLVYP